MNIHRQSLQTALTVSLILGCLIVPQVAFAQTPPLATGLATEYKASVTDFELWNGTDWVPVFSGSGTSVDIGSDAVNPGQVAGNLIAGISVPDGTYTKARFKVAQDFYVKGSVAYNDTTYYTASGPNQSGFCTTTTTAELMAECHVSSPNLNENYAETSAFNLVVANGAPDKNIRLSFGMASALHLDSIGESVYQISIGAPEIQTELY